ncbi:MAG: hypothetical protein JXR34_03575 [Bacteroidales bacterium]|nr:hypothetical protein [Bacteroidales bacterium]
MISFRNLIVTLSFLTLVFTFKPASGQYNYGVYNYYTAGLKMGYEMYSYKMDPSRNVKHEILPNYSFGITGGWYYRYWLEFHADILFTKRDLRVKWLYPADPFGTVPLYSDYKLAFITIPIQARANIIYTRNYKLNFGVGILPEFRFRPPREIVTYQNGVEAESFDSFLVKDFRRLLFGFPISLHNKINFNRHYSTEISFNYMWYVTKMNKVLMDGPGVGYYFNLAFYYDW